ncbi:MAG: hypothetical protein ACMG6E_08030 [Candidatus Roizmanbacteria bacterium]
MESYPAETVSYPGNQWAAQSKADMELQRQQSFLLDYLNKV